MVIHIHINGKLHRINNCVFFCFHVKLLILLALATSWNLNICRFD